MPNLVFRLITDDSNFGGKMDKAQKQIRKLGQSYTNLNKDMNRSSQTMKSFGSLISVGKIALALNITKQLANTMYYFAQASMDAIETQNLFNVSLAGTAIETGKAVDQLSQMYGLDETNIKNSVGTFALLARSMGMSAEQASTLSVSTYKLGLDLSSLTNVPINQVMGDLRSGLVGQSETVYKYGMDVTEAGIKQEAMRQGIDKSVRSMSQGEKMALRYAVMIRTGAIANGDFAKTINTPANQMKILTERFTTLTRSIGNIFIPILTKILPYINAAISLITELANTISAFFGFVPEKDQNTADTLKRISDGSDDAADSMGKAAGAAKKFKATMLGIDQLNVMQSQDTGSSGASKDGAGGPNILDNFKLPSYETMFGDMIDKASGAKKQILDIFNSIKTYLGDLFKNISFDNLKESFGKVSDAAQPLIDKVAPAIDWFMKNILGPIATWTINEAVPSFLNMIAGALTFLNGVIEVFAPMFQWLWDNFFVPVGAWVGQTAVDAMNGIAGALQTIGTWMSDNYETVGKMVILVGDFFAAWKGIELMSFIAQSGGVVKSMSSIIDIIKEATRVKWIDIDTTIRGNILYAVDFVKSMAKATASIATQIAQFVALSAAKAWDAIKTTALTIATGIMQAAQIALNFVMSLNPIMLVVIAIGALIAALVALYNNSEDFRNFVDGMWEGLKQFGSWIATTFTAIWEGLGQTFDSVWKGIKSTFVSIVNGVISGINTLLGAFLNPFNTIIRTLNKVPGVDLPVLSLNIPKIPALAMGGIALSPTLAQIGEAGKEAVIPLENGKLQKYLAPVLGNINMGEDSYEAVYSGVKDALSEQSETPAVYNIYIDGVYDRTIREATRKNVRSGKVMIPVGG